jgi:hypothetical protein
MHDFMVMLRKMPLPERWLQSSHGDLKKMFARLIWSDAMLHGIAPRLRKAGAQYSQSPINAEGRAVMF